MISPAESKRAILSPSPARWRPARVSSRRMDSRTSFLISGCQCRVTPHPGVEPELTHGKVMAKPAVLITNYSKDAFPRILPQIAAGSRPPAADWYASHKAVQPRQGRVGNRARTHADRMVSYPLSPLAGSRPAESSASQCSTVAGSSVLINVIVSIAFGSTGRFGRAGTHSPMRVLRPGSSGG
jgi:hypothetical protein